MAPMRKQDSNYSSNHPGEGAVREANVLASCYLVDHAAALRGLHYCTTFATGAECPPLAALTASNELALTPKRKQQRGSQATSGSGASFNSRRGGAALRIREECERFFCESMRAVFHGERDTASRGSGLTGAYYNHHHHDHSGNASRRSDYNNGQLCTPPENDYPTDRYAVSSSSSSSPAAGCGVEVAAWLEIWDYAGGASFRAFLAEDADGEKSLFAFFDAGTANRDLKQGLMALIELADGPLGCAQLVVCLDRRMLAASPEPDGGENKLIKGLQWAGFSLASLDHWAPGCVDVTSDRWLFMGMEI